jgi:hypothetical protein
MKTQALFAALLFATIALIGCPEADKAKDAVDREMKHQTKNAEDAKTGVGKFYKKTEGKINKLGQDAVNKAEALEKQMDN